MPAKKGHHPLVAKMVKRLRNTPARIGVSRVAGVGLIAVRKIKKGEKLYVEGRGKEKSELVGGKGDYEGHFRDAAGIKHLKCPKREVMKLEDNPETRGIAEMVDAYIPSYSDDEGEEVFPMPETGLDRPHPVWYMNDGGNRCQNVTYINQNQMFGGGVRAMRDIMPGEELFLNYGEITVHQQGAKQSECIGAQGMDYSEKAYPHDKTWARAKSQVDKLRKDAAVAHKHYSLAQMRLAKAETNLSVAARRAGGHRVGDPDQTVRKKSSGSTSKSR